LNGFQCVTRRLRGIDAPDDQTSSASIERDTTATLARLLPDLSRESIIGTMSKVFANENPQGSAPAPSTVPPGSAAAKGAAQVVTVLFCLAIVAGLCLLCYHYWKFAVSFVLAAVLFACGLSRAVTIGLMCVVLVVLAIIGNAARAQTVVDGVLQPLALGALL
jgi:hypothetical protein